MDSHPSAGFAVLFASAVPSAEGSNFAKSSRRSFPRTPMEPIPYKSLPSCTAEFPLEITRDEIAGLAGPINILLKSSYLIGVPGDAVGFLETLFDIAEEVAGVDSGAYVSLDPHNADHEVVAARGIMPSDRSDRSLVVPAVLARHFGKVTLLDADKSPVFRLICGTWNAAMLAVFPMRRDRDVIGALIFGKRDSRSFPPALVKLLWVLAMQAESHLHRSEAVKMLSFYSFLDPLTHLYNRRYFDEQLEREILRSQRNGKPLALLMLDLDGFKSYNDRFLHAAGDIALQEFAGILRDSLREVDTAARIGGDEFAVILVESGPEGAEGFARRIIERLSRHLLAGDGNIRTERLNVSIGVAAFPADAFDRSDLVRKADRALYAAKRRGGGGTCLYQENGDLFVPGRAPLDPPVRKVYDASRSLVDTDGLLEILLLAAMEAFSASRGSIIVPDTHGSLRVRAAAGMACGDGTILAGHAVPGGDATSRVLETGKPFAVSGKDDHPFPRRKVRDGYCGDAFLSFPLVHAGRPVGALHLTNRRDGRPFSREDLDALEPTASLIARILAEGAAFREGVRSLSVAILLSLAGALELRFPFLRGHAERVRNLSSRLAERLRLDGSRLEALRTAALLHDVGNVGVPGAILAKKRRLTKRESLIVRRHPVLGYKLLDGVLEADAIRGMILEHHERFDGSGYPYGLRGDEISLGGRILAVAECFDAVRSDRPHRKGLGREEALQVIGNGPAAPFDPDVVRALIDESSDATTPESSSSPLPESGSCS
jgi:diguanylate cyclase (GGDEF)-like protein